MERRNSHDLCQKFEDLIDAFLDEELDASLKSDFETHIQTCADCREALAFAKRVHHSLSALPQQNFSRERSAAVIAEARREQAKARRAVFTSYFTRFTSFRPLAAVASFAVVLLIILFSLPDGSKKPNFTPEELARAEREIKWTLAYLNDISERASLVVKDDVIEAHVIAPIQKNMFQIKQTKNKARP